MKKALALIVALVVVAWAGATWYTGDRIERDLQAYAAEWTAPLAESAPQLVSFERGFLRSSAEWRIEAIVPDGEPFTARSDIEHGPFPWSRLRQLQFMPVLAWVHAEPLKDSGWQPWFEYAQALPWQVEATIHYRDGVEFLAAFSAVDINEPDVQLQVSAGWIEGRVHGNAEQILMNAEWPAFRMQTGGAAEGSEFSSLAIEQFRWRSNHQAGAAGWYPGESQFTAEQVQIEDNLPLPLRFQQVAFTTQLEESTGEQLNVSADYRIGHLQVADQPLGEFEAGVMMDNLHGPTLREGIEAWQALPLQSDGMPARHESNAVMQATLEALLTHHPRLAIAPMRWTLPQGEILFEASLTLRPAEESGTELSVLQALDAELNVSRPMAVELMARMSQLPGGTDQPLEAARAAAALNLAFMEQLALASGHVEPTEDGFRVRVEQREGQWKLNGRDWNEADELLDTIPLLP